MRIKNIATVKHSPHKIKHCIKAVYINFEECKSASNPYSYDSGNF